VNFGTLFRKHNFRQRISRTLLGARQNLAALGGLPIETYSPNFINFDLGVPRCHAATCISPSLVHLLLWSPYGIGQTIIFLFCDFFFISFFSPTLSRRRY